MTKEYPKWCVYRPHYTYGYAPLMGPRPARRTAKCVFAKLDRGEYRLNLKQNKVWLFDTEDEAKRFVDRHARDTEASEYRRKKKVYYEQSSVSYDKHSEFITLNPPLELSR